MKGNYLFMVLMAGTLLLGAGCGSKTTTEGATTPAAGTPQSASPAATDAAAGHSDLVGTYEMEDQSMGTLATLVIKEEGGKLSYTVDASVGNVAEMTRSAMMTEVDGSTYEDDDGACHIMFKFGLKSVALTHAGSPDACGEVDFAGNYMKK